MKIALISFYAINPGIRSLAGFLINHGIEIKLIHLLPSRIYDEKNKYSDKVLEQLEKLCADCEIIGLSVLTNDLFRAGQITSRLKEKTRSLVVWGGIHPTIAPEECLEYGDAICLGEGEEALLELAGKIKRGENYSETKNFYFKNKGQVIRNSLRPLVRDLDKLPFPYFSTENSYILKGEEITPLSKDELKFLCGGMKINSGGEVKFAYMAIFSRGCPHGCAYCCNNKINELYKGDQPIHRRKSVSSIMEELTDVKRKFPDLGLILIEDDNFLVAPDEEIEKFADLYKKSVKLPFKLLTSPVFVTEEKISALEQAGMIQIHIGIQTGSDRVNREIYKRFIGSKSVLKAAGILKNHPDIAIFYDLIFDNPYETTEDKLATAKLMAALPKPYFLQAFSLTYYPGTEVFRKAKEDGHLTDLIAQTYAKKSNEFDSSDVDYLKLATMLVPWLPDFANRILLNKVSVFCLQRNIFKGLYRTVFLTLKKVKQIKNRRYNPYTDI